jgi:hypothetical protein
MIHGLNQIRHAHPQRVADQIQSLQREIAPREIALHRGLTDPDELSQAAIRDALSL